MNTPLSSNLILRRLLTGLDLRRLLTPSAGEMLLLHVRWDRPHRDCKVVRSRPACSNKGRKGSCVAVISTSFQTGLKASPCQRNKDNLIIECTEGRAGACRKSTGHLGEECTAFDEFTNLEVTLNINGAFSEARIHQLSFFAECRETIRESYRFRPRGVRGELCSYPERGTL